MTSEEAIAALKAMGLYVVAGDHGSFRGGTSRRQEGTIGWVENGFFVGPRDGKWIVTHACLGASGPVDHTCDTVEEAFQRVKAYLDEVARRYEY